MTDRVVARQRRRLVVATVAAAAVAFTSACGSGGNTSQQSGSVTLTEMDYYGTEPNKTALGGLLDSCASQVGVTIKRQVVEDLRTRLLQLAGAQSLPDLILVDNPDLARRDRSAGRPLVARTVDGRLLPQRGRREQVRGQAVRSGSRR